jgi:hypothetical protein
MVLPMTNRLSMVHFAPVVFVLTKADETELKDFGQPGTTETKVPTIQGENKTSVDSHDGIVAYSFNLY